MKTMIRILKQNGGFSVYVQRNAKANSGFNRG